MDKNLKHLWKNQPFFLLLKVAYKQKHDATKGISDYAHMKEPPEIRHAMEVNKRQSNVRNPNSDDLLGNCS